MGLFRRLQRVLAAPFALVALVAGLGACGGDSERLTIYSGRTENLIRPLLDQFEDETGIRVEVRWGDSADLALLLQTEGDRSPADVFISQSPGPLALLASEGRFEPLPEADLAKVSPRFRPADGTWVATSGRVRTLVYNLDLVDEASLPASVFDLVGPEYKGKVAVAPTNGSFQDFMTSVRALKGEDEATAFLQGLKDNDAHPYANNTAIVQAVARGEVAMGLVNHYYLERAKADDPNVDASNYFFPDGDLGSLLLTAGVGVLTSNDRGDDARRFVEFLLSDSAQQYFAQETYEYPVVDSVPPVAGQPPIDEIASVDEDLNALGSELRATKELIDASGLSAS